MRVSLSPALKVHRELGLRTLCMCMQNCQDCWLRALNVSAGRSQTCDIRRSHPLQVHALRALCELAPVASPVLQHHVQAVLQPLLLLANGAAGGQGGDREAAAAAAALATATAVPVRFV